MKVYAASDLHGEMPDPPPDADVLLIAGDICPDFRGSNAAYLDKHGTRQRDWLIREWAPWLKNIGKPTVFTWGNHDFIGEKPWLVKDVINELPLDVTLVKDSAAIVAGLRIYGTPWVPGLPYWAFYGSERALQNRAALIRADLDVLMTHGPPYGHGDYIPGGSEKQVSKYGNIDGMHVGDLTLNDAIKLTRPRVTICGHIHEARGRYDLDGSPIVNCASVDAVYDLRPNPWTRLYELES